MSTTTHERIIRLRERAGLSQRELHAETGISQATLSRIEAGARPARLDEVLLISTAVGCDPSTILDDSPLEDRVLVAHRAQVQGVDASDVRSRLIAFLEMDEYLERHGIPA